jgi:spermidine synthase
LKPWELLGSATTADGTALTLKRRDTEYVILTAGHLLMSNRQHGSEEALATLSCTRLRSAEAPVVLIGGLGMGYTLRATLDILPPSASVVVAELVPEVVTWNRGPLGPLAKHPLADPRVTVEVADVLVVMRANPGRFDAILLDTDNGPEAFCLSRNAALYGDTGLFAARSALKFGGTLAVWSAGDDRRFLQRLRFVGFTVKSERVRARAEQRGGARHTIFLATNG